MLRCHSVIAVLFAALLPGPLPAQSASPASSSAASWIGKYKNADLEFELKPGPPPGLTGVIAFNGQHYLATARADGDKLTGTFRTSDSSFPYEARRKGNELRFVTGDTEYLLRREGIAPAPNPLAVRNSPKSPATPPAPGKLVEFSPGFSLRLPNGWTSKETSDGFMLLPAGASFDPQRDDNPEVYLAALRNDYDPNEEAQTVQQLSAAVALSGGRGGQRQPATFGPRTGAIYNWEFPHLRSGALTAFDIYLAAEGQRAIIVVAVGQKARVRGNDATVRQIVASVTGSAPQSVATSKPVAPQASGPLADSTPLARRWLEKLHGKVVRQFWASQGMSSDKRHWLNEDGTYSYKSSSMVSVDAGGASGLSTGRDDSTGRWRIRDISGEVFLEVHYNNGTVRQMRITEDNRNWYLNGEKAFAVNP